MPAPRGASVGGVTPARFLVSEDQADVLEALRLLGMRHGLEVRT